MDSIWNDDDDDDDGDDDEYDEYDEYDGYEYDEDAELLMRNDVWRGSFSTNQQESNLEARRNSGIGGTDQHAPLWRKVRHQHVPGIRCVSFLMVGCSVPTFQLKITRPGKHTKTFWT